jgi:hypothetical protein
MPIDTSDDPAATDARLLASQASTVTANQIDTAPVDTSADPAATDARLLASQASTVAANQINTDTDVTLDDPEAARLLASSASTVAANKVNTTPQPSFFDSAGAAISSVASAIGGALGVGSPAGGSPLASLIQQGISNAQGQAARATQMGFAGSYGDWRVKLSLARGASYLYNDWSASSGILQPLQATGGVIFPYTPKIDMSYKADYQKYNPTHSNFRGYYYQNSYVNDITVMGKFTAQDSQQANYLLAVIHFLRSATKMFYGQDAQRGSPPPLLFLSGLGDFQFNNHPCLLASFTYTLPDDVDYIRAQVSNQSNLNLTLQNVVKQAVPVIGTAISAGRLANAFANKGALPNVPFGTGIPGILPNLSQGTPTYVPTKMDISITLLPVNTRQQVSQQFSLQQYANGNGLKGGFW